MLPEMHQSMLLTTDQPSLGRNGQSFILQMGIMHAVVLCVLPMCVSDTAIVLALTSV